MSTTIHQTRGHWFLRWYFWALRIIETDTLLIIRYGDGYVHGLYKTRKIARLAQKTYDVKTEVVRVQVKFTEVTYNG